MKKAQTILITIAMGAWIVLVGCRGESSDRGPAVSAVASAQNLLTHPATPDHRYPRSIPVVRQTVALSNDFIEVQIDSADGHILQITDRVRSLNLLTPSTNRVGFAPLSYQILAFDDDTSSYAVEDFGPRNGVILLPNPAILSTRPLHPGGRAATIEWRDAAGRKIIGRIDIPPDRARVEFRVDIDAPGEMIYSVTYPYLFGVAPLAGDGAADRLALPVESGVEISNPIANIRTLWNDSQSFLGAMEYPRGHDLMLPLLAYYSPGVGGFSLSVDDPLWTERVFRFYPSRPASPSGLPTLALTSLNWDVEGAEGWRKGRMVQDRPVVLEALDHPDWESAAERYRESIADRPWAAGRVADRHPQRRRVFENVGLSVFGLSSREDMSEWMRVFHNEFAAPFEGAGVLFTAGWDFHPGGTDFGGEFDYAFYQAGWNADFWLPYAEGFLDRAAQARERGDLVVPFLYDLLVHDAAPGWSGWTGDLIESGDEGAPWIEHASIRHTGAVNTQTYDVAGVDGELRELCPADRTTREFVEWRRALLAGGSVDAGDAVIDGLYYDVPVTLLGSNCFDRLGGYMHTHLPMGWGRFMTDSKRAMLEQGRLADPGFVYGVENLTEPFLDLVDYYHLGAPGDGPYRPAQNGGTPEEPLFQNINRLLMTGQAAQIPLVEFVTHEFGPLRTGGKTQISPEVGDAWYWVTAYNYVNGGILELIYFNTPTDLFDDVSAEAVDCPSGYPCAYQTGWIGDRNGRGWHDTDLKAADSDKVVFLRNAIDLRLNLGDPWLTAGRMLPKPILDPAPTAATFDYDFYAAITGEAAEHHGEWDAEPVVIAAYADPEDPTETAVFAANAGEAPWATTIVMDAERWGLPASVSAEWSRAGGDVEWTQVFEADPEGLVRVPVTIDARALYRLRLSPVSRPAPATRLTPSAARR